MWLPLGVGNVVCVNGVVYVWSDLFQSVLSPPFSGMLMKTGSLHPSSAFRSVAGQRIFCIS